MIDYGTLYSVAVLVSSGLLLFVAGYCVHRSGVLPALAGLLRPRRDDSAGVVAASPAPGGVFASSFAAGRRAHIERDGTLTACTQYAGDETEDTEDC